MTTAPHVVPQRSWESLHTDEKLALQQASARLADRFTGLYGPETIERFLASSFDQFAARAKVTRFLPLLAERFATQRLQAWHASKGSTTTASRWSSSCAPTTPDAPRWRSASSRH